MSSSKLPPFNADRDFQWSQPPNPFWKPGDGLSMSSDADAYQWKEDEAQGTTAYDPADSNLFDTYKLLVSGITPRPIALVSSVSEDGVHNLAPFSYFSLLGHDPPLVSISFNAPGRPRDTALNIKATKTFTVNMMSEPFVEAANWSHIDAPFGTDEWSGTGLTQEPSELVIPPRVKESAFSMECELFQYHDFHPTHPSSNPDSISQTLVIGLIKRIHVRNSVLLDNPNPKHSQALVVDPAKFKVVSRLGGCTYGRVGGGYDMERLVWANLKEAEPLRSIYEVERPKAATEVLDR